MCVTQCIQVYITAINPQFKKLYCWTYTEIGVYFAIVYIKVYVCMYVCVYNICAYKYFSNKLFLCKLNIKIKSRWDLNL